MVSSFLLWGLPKLLHFCRVPNESRSLLALVGSLSNGILYLSSPILLPVMNTFPQMKTRVMILGYVICVAGLIGAAYARTAGELIVTQGVLYAVGGSLLYFPMMSYMFEWFHVKLGLANGILFSGASAGGVIAPFVIEAILDRWGRKVTLLSLAITLIIFIVPCFPFLRPRLPVKNVDHRRSWSNSGYFRFLYIRTFWILISATVFQSLGNFIPFLFLPSFASELGLSTTSGTLAVSLVNGASAPGMIFLGWLSDKYDLRIAMVISSLGSSLSVFLLWGMSGTLAVYIIFACVYGFLGPGWGALFPRFVSATIDHDPERSSSLLAIFLAVRGTGNILAAPLSGGLIRDWALTGRTGLGYGVGGYGPLIIFTGATLLASCFGIIYRMSCISRAG
ncbi:hypothetical protein D9758_013025 [Tetrapyrgos nigripes]|uniref:Major facilitator superfamily (MFS) profile domain-containing protein n=1 Tax=Tetrapyrgos nigripes TaxID=182062 RepID=A0A8H5FII1_9AGAR|nr:hypothetical protein D9758_013025 [Tetrapyrgos nigripes]